ncbi:MAG: hypothetical protein JSW04_15035 [Desulfobacterales bacterium]|nr:MAG: hypothetical protein JSV38_03740 [Desulfobacterales bacterium]UCD89693.1 MAG: hypothetical protein JSW04_15035 [Desulfobacterales bacterium]
MNKNMDTKKAIIVYQYSERIKSELIIASGLVSTMETLDGKELNGAEKLMTSFLDALIGEIRIAQHVEKSMNFIGAEKKIREAKGKMKLNEHTEMNRCISDALSLITTSCQRAMEFLINEHLI